MTSLTAFAVGAFLMLALVVFVVLPIAQRVAARQRAALERRRADQRVRLMLAQVVASINQRRPRGGFDMPPSEIAYKRMVETTVLGMPGGGLTIQVKTS